MTGLGATARTTARPVHVVVVPGMGLTAYVDPTVDSLRARGHRASVLDLPGFGSPRPLACRPTVREVAATAAAWLRAEAHESPGQRLVLLGHSTGAVSALLAGLELQDEGVLAGVVLAGPVATPSQRSLPRIIAAAPRAYRRDSPRELVELGQLARGGPDAVRLLRSALAERPEELVTSLRLPLVLTAGRADAFAPSWWLSQLASAALASPSVGVARLPGSHNNLFTHPDQVAAVAEGLGATPTIVR
ncbi:MAG TPA: alpha/beta fold hydrolase [Actinomycetales bacterium]